MSFLSLRVKSGVTPQTPAISEPGAIAPIHKSFLKWAGGKSKLLPKLRELGIEKGHRFIEPFVGSGVVSLNMPHKKIIIGDTNRALVNLWSVIGLVKDKHIDDAREIFTLHFNNPDKERFYYDMRGCSMNFMRMGIPRTKARQDCFFISTATVSTG